LNYIVQAKKDRSAGGADGRDSAGFAKAQGHSCLFETSGVKGVKTVALM